MFKIKICGLTTIDDALAAAAAGADALGLNFHPASPRYVTPDQAARIVQAVRQAGWSGAVVAVVVEGETRLHAVAERLGIDAWQLHGEQSPAQLAAFRRLLTSRPSRSPIPPLGGGGVLPPDPASPTPGEWRVIRALAYRDASLEPVLDYLRACAENGGMPDALLLDASHGGLRGGTGRTLDWASLAAQRGRLGAMPLILAGGLTPENVASAIQEVRPAAVDVASGVEAVPGRKDKEKLRAFVAAAREAFQALPPST